MTTDKPRIGELLRVGADPDCQVGNLNNIHDFDTSTPRQVAATMGLDDLVANMPKVRILHRSLIVIDEKNIKKKEMS